MTGEGRVPPHPVDRYENGFFVDESGVEWVCRCFECGGCYNPNVESAEVHAEECTQYPIE